MAYMTYTKDPIGAFVEKENNNTFEFSINDEQDEYSLKIRENYPHKVWVGGGQINDRGWRYASVKKTVAYIIIDEDDGGPVLQRWDIKKFWEYV